MIRFENVSKKLCGRIVLDKIDFEVNEGETFVIVGPSGAGKSVTLKHLVCLLRPDEGRVVVGDEVISEAVGDDLDRMRRQFGVLFQSGALLEWLTVEENVALPLREKTDMPGDRIIASVRHKLGLVGLEEEGGKHPSELSGGMRKRAGLARALIEEPKIVLYDEPTSGLDPVTSRSIDQLIDRMRRELNVTSVVVTHDMLSALSIGSRIAMINEGKIIENGTPDEFVRSRTTEVRQFLDAQHITQANWQEVRK